jgi:hypothetical protein
MRLELFFKGNNCAVNFCRALRREDIFRKRAGAPQRPADTLGKKNGPACARTLT